MNKNALLFGFLLVPVASCAMQGEETHVSSIEPVRADVVRKVNDLEHFVTHNGAIYKITMPSGCYVVGKTLTGSYLGSCACNTWYAVALKDPEYCFYVFKAAYEAAHGQCETVTSR
jgi:hypothetical protein